MKVLVKSLGLVTVALALASSGAFAKSAKKKTPKEEYCCMGADAQVVMDGKKKLCAKLREAPSAEAKSKASKNFHNACTQKSGTAEKKAAK